MKIDYIIVGLGLAGIAFAEELLAANKTFLVFEDHSQNSSLAAAGLYNPIILKRFTLVWNAMPQLKTALPFYKKIEEKLNISLDEKWMSKKIFSSVEEQNNWFLALDKPQLCTYLDAKLDTNQYKGLSANFGFGNVHQTGRIDTKKLVESYKDFLQSEKKICFEKFDYKKVIFQENTINYKNIYTNKIIFCEGYGLKNNPFFNNLPLNGTKGELITIYAPLLEVNFLVKSSLFIFPLGNNYFKVGATFNWSDKTSIPTTEGRNELIEKLKKIIDVPYTIVEQSAGIRPTVKDRRPLVGTHPKYKNVAILNGLGTRGVMLAPTMAKALFNHLEKGVNLDPEIAITRFF